MSRKFAELPGLSLWQSLKWEWRRYRASAAALKLLDRMQDCTADNRLVLALRQWSNEPEEHFQPRSPKPNHKDARS